jgi:calnexin
MNPLTILQHANLPSFSNEQIREANLLEDFQPAFNPEKEIDDEKDSKPDTWVDEATIADPAAVKPEDVRLTLSFYDFHN